MEYIYEKDRIWLRDENGEMKAFISFPEVEKNIVVIDHTVVDESLRGQGIADKLVRRASEYIREKGLRARVTCSYAVHWFEKNHEFDDILI